MGGEGHPGEPVEASGREQPERVPALPPLVADPRVTITVWDAKNPYAYVEVRGRVVGEVRGQLARDHIDALSRRYTGHRYTADITSERVIMRIAPDRQRSVGLD